MKVIHLPLNIGGNPEGTSKSLRQLGVTSQTWVISQNYLEYQADKIISAPTNNRLTAELKKFFALRYIFEFDVIIFNGGRSLYKPFNETKNFSFLKSENLLKALFHAFSWCMARVELGLLKLLKKTIFVVYQGSDARQNDFCNGNFKIKIPYENYSEYGSLKFDKMKRKSIKFYSKYAKKIYALNPDLLHVLPNFSEFLPYCHVDISKWNTFYTQKSKRPLRIGHAPTNQGLKGTSLIKKAVKRLKDKGFEFEFVVVEGLSFKEAVEIYKSLDILVDQLFAGWYGGLAVELMALGKPVVTYIREGDLKFIPQEMKQELPFFKAEPETIEKVLEQILNLSRTQIFESAIASRKFVEKWHDPIKIAKKIIVDIGR
jgi:glycosyltransferase involved in cell wall biosynthesis